MATYLSCEWCKGHHDIRGEKCREIQRIQEQRERDNPTLRDMRLRDRLRDLERPRIRG